MSESTLNQETAQQAQNFDKNRRRRFQGYPNSETSSPAAPPPEQSTPTTPETISPLEKQQLATSLDILALQCDPQFGNLAMCLNLPPDATIDTATVKSARNQQLKKFNPDLISARYQDQNLTQKADDALKHLNGLVDQFFAQHHEARPVTSSPTPTPEAPVRARPEQSFADRLDRCRSIDDIARAIDQMGGLRWGEHINTGEQIKDLFMSINPHSSVFHDRQIFYFPPEIRPKLTELFYQRQIETAQSMKEFNFALRSIGEFHINGKVYTADDIFRLLDNGATLATSPILEHYGLRRTYARLRHQEANQKRPYQYTYDIEGRRTPWSKERHPRQDPPAYQKT